MQAQKPYSDAINTGQYAKYNGLTGKYDNVRRFWEDEVSRIFLYPYLKKFMENCFRLSKPLRILDLGCGAGDGYEFLTSLRKKDCPLHKVSHPLITTNMIKYYLGLDLNQDLLNQASQSFGNQHHIDFKQGDFSNGLPVKEEAFNIYFTSYGSLSHNTDQQNIHLLSEIAQYCEDNALIIGEWLGRYSYEWQELWELEPLSEQWIDYRISYIYSEEERKERVIESFPLRVISDEEIRQIVYRASEESNIQFSIKQIMDKSLFVGRHMETGEYNSNPQSIRKKVNSLFEPNIRTELSSLNIKYQRKQGFGEINHFFENFALCWNIVVEFTNELLHKEGQLSANEILTETLIQELNEATFPLKKALKTMSKAVNNTLALPGDPRANIIEPQLATSLRQLELELQPGGGMGHGIIAVIEIKK